MNSNILYMESTESNRICHSTYLSPGSTSRRPMYAMFFADKLKIIEKISLLENYRQEFHSNAVLHITAMYPGKLPWFDEFKSRKLADVWLKFLHQEWQGHSMHVSRWWRQRSIDVCVRINPNNHVLWFCQGMAEDRAYGHAVIPSQGQTSPPRLDDVIHIGSDLSKGISQLDQGRSKFRGQISTLFIQIDISDRIT